MNCYYKAGLKGGGRMFWEGRDLSTLTGGGETWKILSLNITPSNAPTEIMNFQMASFCMYVCIYF